MYQAMLRRPATMTCIADRPKAGASRVRPSGEAAFRLPPRPRSDLAVHPLVLAAGLAVLLTGCSGWQNALDTASPDAGHIAWLLGFFTVVLGLVWALVVIVGLAVARSRTRAIDEPLAPHPQRHSRATTVIFGLTAATLVIVLVLTG